MTTNGGMVWFSEAVDGVFNTACLQQDHGLLALCCDNASDNTLIYSLLS